jgi:hypothetical protein
MTQYYEHILETVVGADEPPLSPEERRQRVVQLCCNFMRNLAFHRAGMDPEVQRELFNSRHPQGSFWRQLHGSFFDICVLDWCKLFADLNKGRHSWRRVIQNPDQFAAVLYAELGVAPDEFAALVEKVRRYRDKFVAHLDEERRLLLPTLDQARRAVVFLHKRLVLQAGGHGDWGGLAPSSERLSLGYEQASREAHDAYAGALAHLPEARR